MKRIVWILSSLILLISCNKEYSNPTLKENEIIIYLKGSGSTVSLLGAQGYICEVGDSTVIDLQVSPAKETQCKWIDSKDSLLKTGLRYAYKPLKIEQKNIRFIATRTNGFSDTILFKFNGVISGLESAQYGKWTESTFVEPQTGVFDTYFTVSTTGDQLNSVVGLGQGNTTTYANLSCLIRFNMNSNPGTIDVFKGDGKGSGSYSADAQITYGALQDYNFKVSVNVVSQQYSVFVQQNGSYVALATNYPFRVLANKLTSWAIFSDGTIRGNGTISVKNKSITTISQNKSPLIDKVVDLKKEEGMVFTQIVKVTDPLGGVVKIVGTDMPRFATLTDNGNNTATIRFAPYANCGGCDIGVHKVTVEATNSMETSALSFNVEIVEKTNKITLNANVADGVVYDQSVQAIAPSTTPSTLVIGKGPLPGSATVFAHSTAIIPFDIPTLEAGMKVTNASFSVNVELNNAWKNVRYDLYALPARASAAILNSDYYMAAATDPTVGVSLIQSGFVVNNQVSVGPIGVMKSDATGSVNLTTFINNLLANVPSGAKYFFLRVNPNRSDLDNWIRLNFSSAETLTPPAIEITFGPK
ncbi:MAG: hypothetical protein PHV20_04345 [Bacteroidales bacterium]|nr:hypothetical protein [Bacteroidales bacterium]